MHKFLETYNLPSLKQEVIENWYRPITSSESESVIKTPPTNQNQSPGPGPDSFTGEVHQTSQEKLRPKDTIIPPPQKESQVGFIPRMQRWFNVYKSSSTGSVTPIRERIKAT